MPGLQYAIGATLVVVGFLIVNMATLSDVDEKVSVRQRELVDDVEGEDEFDTEDNFRRMARALSISEYNRNRRESNASVLSEHL